MGLCINSEGGLFKARLSFPSEYPFMPPSMRFASEMWHPNSKLCYILLNCLFLIANLRAMHVAAFPAKATFASNSRILTSCFARRTIAWMS